MPRPRCRDEGTHSPDGAKSACIGSVKCWMVPPVIGGGRGGLATPPALRDWVSGPLAGPWLFLVLDLLGSSCSANANRLLASRTLRCRSASFQGDFFVLFLRARGQCGAWLPRWYPVEIVTAIGLGLSVERSQSFKG